MMKAIRCGGTSVISSLNTVKRDADRVAHELDRRAFSLKLIVYLD